MIETLIPFVIGALLGFVVAWFSKSNGAKDIHNLKLSLSARLKEKEQLSKENRELLQRLEQCTAELVTAMGNRVIIEPDVEVHNKAARLANEELQKLRKTVIELNDKMKGFEVFRASDARIRALKKAPAKMLNPLVKWLNDSIKADQYQKWKNPPKPMRLKK